MKTITQKQAVKKLFRKTKSITRTIPKANWKKISASTKWTVGKGKYMKRYALLGDGKGDYK